jgi:hypothetical protein
MPYDMNQIRLSFTSYNTREYYNYENIWSIEDVTGIQSVDPESNPVHIMLVRFKRKIRNYLYTLPSYIVYILTLLMFMLPQTSNQRVTIGSVSLTISTLLTYMLTVNMPHSQVSAWPLLGKLITKFFESFISVFYLNSSIKAKCTCSILSY